MSDLDAPKLAEDITHATIGSHLHLMREILDDLIYIRVREFGALLDKDEGELLSLKGSLDFLLSDIRETRVKQSRNLRVVR